MPSNPLLVNLRHNFLKWNIFYFLPNFSAAPFVAAAITTNDSLSSLQVHMNISPKPCYKLRYMSNIKCNIPIHFPDIYTSKYIHSNHGQSQESTASIAQSARVPGLNFLGRGQVQLPDGTLKVAFRKTISRVGS